MKKIVKMSLVAAVAVTGLTTANAKPLEEAIKNVDVSGTVVYRYEDRSFDDNVGDSSSNNYKIGLNLKSKVNDDVSAVTRFLVAKPNPGGLQADGGFATLDNTTTGDKNPEVTLSNVYFSYTGIANTTVNVGKQGLTTPWTVAVDSDGNEQTGTGILALTSVGPVTLAAAYFNQTNLDVSGDAKINGSETLGDTYNAAVNGIAKNSDSFTGVPAQLDGAANILTVGAMANVGPVALDAWYLDMQDLFDTYTVGAAAKFDLDAVKLSVGARHTELEFDKKVNEDLAKEDNSLTKIMLGLKAGIFGANVNYGWTDKQGGLAALDNDATTAMQGWTVQLNGFADAQYLQVSVDAQVLESLNIALKYHQLDKDKIDGATGTREKDATDTETYVQVTYDMSKNLSTYIRFGEQELERAYTKNGDVKDAEGTIGRLQVQYSF